MTTKNKEEETEHTRVTKAGEEGMVTKRHTPDDLDDYKGTYVETSSGEEFGLKKMPDDPKGLTHHLKNALHYHALTEADFKKLFEKK